MRNDAEIGIQIGEILLPNETVDLNKWAVIACDQFTSQPEYWQKVKEIVGDAPSTLQYDPARSIPGHARRTGAHPQHPGGDAPVPG